jgi:transposase
MKHIWQPPELRLTVTQGGSKMSRHDLTDREYEAIRPFLRAAKKGSRGRPWTDHRTIINGILWVLHTGSPWRDLPAEFGKWQAVYNRFRRWIDE